MCRAYHSAASAGPDCCVRRIASCDGLGLPGRTQSGYYSPSRHGSAGRSSRAAAGPTLGQWDLVPGQPASCMRAPAGRAPPHHPAAGDTPRCGRAPSRSQPRDSDADVCWPAGCHVIPGPTGPRPLGYGRPELHGQSPFQGAGFYTCASRPLVTVRGRARTRCTLLLFLPLQVRSPCRLAPPLRLIRLFQPCSLAARLTPLTPPADFGSPH